jgi:hypothetical protein
MRLFTVFSGAPTISPISLNDSPLTCRIKNTSR